LSYYNRLKLQQNQSRFSKIIRGRLIWLGQNVNYYNTIINRKIFKISSTTSVTELSDEKALEKGAETISEFIVYSILIIIPIAEWIRQSKNSKKKELQKEKYINEMKNELEEAILENRDILNELEEIKKQINDINIKLL
jgi:hypothetical protein